MKPRRKYSKGGPLISESNMQLASGIAGGLGGINTLVAPLMGTDRYGGQTAGAHALSGAATGASMGAMLGPWGMAAGAVLGAGAGLLGNKKEDKLADEAEQRSRAALSFGYAYGGKLYPTGSSFYPNIKMLEGSLNARNMLFANDKDFLNNYALGGELEPISLNRLPNTQPEFIPLNNNRMFDPNRSFRKNGPTYREEANRLDSLFNLIGGTSTRDIAESNSLQRLKQDLITDQLKANGGTLMKKKKSYNKRPDVFKIRLESTPLSPKDLEALHGRGNIYKRLMGPKDVYPDPAFADGGELTEYGNGGIHEENPYGGIPLGTGPNGQPNLVEEGETRWNDYIFSNRLKVHKPTMHGLPDKLKDKTFADASKILEKESKERPYDKISQRGRDTMMGRLKESSEIAREIKEIEESNSFATGGNTLWDRFGSKRQANLNLSPLVTTPMIPGIASDREKLIGTYRHTGLNAPEFNTTSYGKTPLNWENTKPHGSNVIGEGSASTGDRYWLNSAMRYSPVAFNAIAGLTLKKPDKVDLPRIGGGLSRFGYTPKYVDETRGLGSINSGYRGVLNSLQGVSGGNAAATRAGILASMPGYLKGRESLYSSINALNLDQYTRAKESERQLGLQGALADSQMALQEEDINARNMGAYTSSKYGLLGAAATGLGQIGSENYWGEIAPRVYGYDRQARFSNNMHKCGGKLKTMKRK